MNKNSETSVLIGADNSMLDTYTNLRVGKEKKSVGLKEKPVWLIFGANENKNKTLSMKAFSKECNLHKKVSKFW